MSSVKQACVILAALLVLVSAVLFGQSLPAEAAAVIIGVVCGLAAGIPTSVLLLVVLSRRERAASQLRVPAPPQCAGTYTIIDGWLLVDQRPGDNGSLPVALPERHNDE